MPDNCLNQINSSNVWGSLFCSCRDFLSSSVLRKPARVSFHCLLSITFLFYFSYVLLKSSVARCLQEQNISDCTAELQMHLRQDLINTMIKNSNIFWNSQFSTPTTQLYPTYTSTSQMEGLAFTANHSSLCLLISLLLFQRCRSTEISR